MPKDMQLVRRIRQDGLKDFVYRPGDNNKKDKGGKGGGRKGKGLRRGGVVIMELWRGWNNKWISGGGLVVPHWRILLA